MANLSELDTIALELLTIPLKDLLNEAAQGFC